jgi:hypothetical protein
MLHSLDIIDQVDPFTQMFPDLLRSEDGVWCLEAMSEPHTPKVFDLLEIACVRDGIRWLPMLVEHYQFPMVIGVTTLLLRLVARAGDSVNCLNAARWVLERSRPLSSLSYVVHLAKALESKQEASVRLLLEFSNGHSSCTDKNVQNMSPLGVAARVNYLRGVQLLYATVPVVDYTEVRCRLLITAVLCHAHQVLDWLLDKLQISTYYIGEYSAYGDVYATKFGDVLGLAMRIDNLHAVRRIVEAGHDTTIPIEVGSRLACVIESARRVAATREVGMNLPSDLANMVGLFIAG